MAVYTKDCEQEEGNENKKDMDNEFKDSDMRQRTRFNKQRANCCNFQNLSTLQKVLIATVIITTIAAFICVVVFLPKKLAPDACIGSERCQNGGTCVHGPNNNNRCVCAQGYEGEVCATATNNCARNPCLNGGTCENEIGSFSCICLDEFAGETCQYINECTYQGSCAHSKDPGNCHRCRYGFVKDLEDDTRCKLADANATLIISSSTGIKLISLDGTYTTQTIQNGDNVAGTDYNFRTNTLYWFSGSDRKIYTAQINGESAKKSILHDSSSWIDGVAVDWVHQHLYWVDRKRDQLAVSNFDGTMKKVLFNNELPYPGSIAVDPLNGWMYWTGTLKSRIERAGLDGSRREVILDNDASSDRTPESLAVDFVDRRLYWSETGHPSSIWSSEFDGSDQKLLLDSMLIDTPSSYFLKIATFDKYIYFIDQSSDTIYEMNKCNMQEWANESINTPKNRGMTDIHIFNAALQPEGKNLCLKRFERCSHFCFPVPSPGNGSAYSVYTTTVCACPDGLSLLADEHNCV